MLSKLSRAGEWIGNLWGRASTILLSLGMALLSELAKADPTVISSVPWLPQVTFWLGIALAVLRVLAPPPPSIAIHRDDEVHVDRDAGIVTIAKAADIPPKIVDKPAGEKM